MHAFVRSPLCLFRINQSINQSHQQSFEPARKPPPDAYRPTAATAIGREETPSRRVQKQPRVAPAPPRPPVSPSQSMSAARWAARVPPLCPCVYLPPCVYPGYTHTPSTPPSRRSSTHRSGHVHGTRAGEISHPPSPHKKRKKRKEPPPLPLQNAKINTHGGRSSSYSTHPRVRPNPARTRVRDG